jgi:hypothetical protein
MRILKRTGMVVLAAAALSVPSAASAISINGHGLGLQRLLISWSHEFEAHNGNHYGWFKKLQQHYSSHYNHLRDTKPPENSVPEPTAALLFGLGAVLVASRSRKSS